VLGAPALSWRRRSRTAGSEGSGIERSAKRRDRSDSGRSVDVLRRMAAKRRSAGSRGGDFDVLRTSDQNVDIDARATVVSTFWA
jgi:hypothetical protein